jgi:hypothetical protein
VNVVAATLLDNEIFVEVPEQIVWVFPEATGIGFTVTVAPIALPVQPLAAGVMVYVAVPAVVALAVNVCAMVLPLELLAPVTFDCDAVQLNVVPLTPFGLLMEIDEAWPEQIV